MPTRPCVLDEHSSELNNIFKISQTLAPPHTHICVGHMARRTPWSLRGLKEFGDFGNFSLIGVFSWRRQIKHILFT